MAVDPAMDPVWNRAGLVGPIPLTPPSRSAWQVGHLSDNDEETILHLLMFSDIWNGIVKELREGDLISNAERDNMLFVHLVIDPSIKPVEGMRPFMLPIFFYGGKVKGALESGSGIDASQRVALKEIRALLVWLLLQLGIIDDDQVRKGGRQLRIHGDCVLALPSSADPWLPPAHRPKRWWRSLRWPQP